MTETTGAVFERHEIRKTKAQKTAFIEYVSGVAEEQGYTCRVEQNSSARNIVVGDVKSAKAVYTAHYDTCSAMPFPNFITPKNFLIYLVYQILVVLLVYAPVFAVVALTNYVALKCGMEETVRVVLGEAVLMVGMFSMLWLIVAGPANKHTANDNTSGVTTLLDLMCSLPEDQKGKVAFIFFDLEERGLRGSKAYYAKHKADMKDKLLLNFDCVSDGEYMLFAVRKGAQKYLPSLERAFVGDGTYEIDFATRGVFYPSDQASFPCGVGVAALKKSKRGNLLYMNRIHTKKDTVYNEKNVEFLVRCTLRLTEIL